MSIIHIAMGGPVQTIQVNGNRYRFEWHPHCGPIALDSEDNEATDQPDEFLEAASFWGQQGKKMGDDGLCAWEWPERKDPITKKLNRRNYLVTGFKTIPARKGE